MQLFLGAYELARGVFNLALGLFGRSLSFHLLVVNGFAGSFLDLAASFLSGPCNAILIHRSCLQSWIARRVNTALYGLVPQSKSRGWRIMASRMRTRATGPRTRSRCS